MQVAQINAAQLQMPHVQPATETGNHMLLDDASEGTEGTEDMDMDTDDAAGTAFGDVEDDSAVEVGDDGVVVGDGNQGNEGGGGAAGPGNEGGGLDNGGGAAGPGNEGGGLDNDGGARLGNEGAGRDEGGGLGNGAAAPDGGAANNAGNRNADAAQGRGKQQGGVARRGGQLAKKQKKQKKEVVKAAWHGQARSRVAQRYWFLAAQTSPEAMTQLGHLHWYGVAGEMDANRTEAEVCYKKASDKSEPEAQFVLGYLWLSGLGSFAANATTQLLVDYGERRNQTVQLWHACKDQIPCTIALCVLPIADVLELIRSLLPAFIPWALEAAASFASDQAQYIWKYISSYAPDLSALWS